MKHSFLYGICLLFMLTLTEEANGNKNEISSNKGEEHLLNNMMVHNQRVLEIVMECWGPELIASKKLSKENENEIINKKAREVEEITGEKVDCIRKTWSEKFPEACLNLNSCYLRMKKAAEEHCGPEVKRPQLFTAGKEQPSEEEINTQLDKRVNWLKCRAEKQLEKGKEIAGAGSECNVVVEKLSDKTCEKL